MEGLLLVLLLLTFYVYFGILKFEGHVIVNASDCEIQRWVCVLLWVGVC